MIKYEFHFKLGKGLSQQQKAVLNFELRALSALCFGHVPDMQILKGDWSGLVLMAARHEGRLVGFSFANMFADKSEITTCVHPAYDDEELEWRLPASLKFSRNWRLLWRRSKIPASLMPSRLLP